MGMHGEVSFFHHFGGQGKSFSVLGGQVNSFVFSGKRPEKGNRSEFLVARKILYRVPVVFWGHVNSLVFSGQR